VFEVGTSLYSVLHIEHQILGAIALNSGCPQFGHSTPKKGITFPPVAPKID